jgi:hypothetical protein
MAASLFIPTNLDKKKAAREFSRGLCSIRDLDYAGFFFAGFFGVAGFFGLGLAGFFGLDLVLVCGLSEEGIRPFSAF